MKAFSMRRLSVGQFLLMLIISVGLLSAASGLVTGLIIKSGIDKTTARLDAAGVALHDGQVAACVRANTQAAKDNRANKADWVFDRLFVAAVKHPQVRQTRRQRRVSRSAVKPLEQVLATRTWTPLIENCSATVRRRGSNYVLPQPVPFNRRQPPRSALRVPPPPPLRPPASNHTP